MVRRVSSEDFDLTLKFGGGLSTRSAEDEIDDREAADGQNFVLDAELSEFVGRSPFDLVTTAANAGSIRGGGSFVDSAGVVHAFFQAGDTVYEFNGTTLESTTLDTVNSGAELRAHWRSHAWELDDKMIVTDLSLLEPVMEWDGTTWADVAFTNEAASGFGTFGAKYCRVQNERVLFAHVKDNGVTVPHMMVGSEVEDYTVITVANKPASALGEADPFYLLAPDLKPINALEGGLGALLLSTEKGELFALTGTSAKDFAFTDFYKGSNAIGEEAVAFVGNDVFYGRQGRVESLTDTDRFGDSEADDITAKIANKLKDYNGWTLTYNSRLNRVYLFPTDASEVWVYQLALRKGERSPWMRWKTDHALAFQPTFVQSMLDPGDGLEYIFMGDASGNIYRLEGSGTAGDAGTTDICAVFLSKLFSIPLDAEAYDIEGYIKYRRGLSNAIHLELVYSGGTVYEQAVSLTLPTHIISDVYSGSVYYSNETYYGSEFQGRLERKKFFVAGGSNEFQVRVRVDGVNSFAVNEIGLRFKASS